MEITKETLKTLIRTIKDLEKQSNCLHRQVGSVLYDTVKKKVVSIGVNTTPSEKSPCVESNCCTKHQTGRCPIIHSEVKCILYCTITTEVINFKDTILLCSYSPCYECSKVIVEVGIPKVMFLNLHHKTDWDYLLENNVEVLQIKEEELNNEKEASNIN